MTTEEHIALLQARDVEQRRELDRISAEWHTAAWHRDRAMVELERIDQDIWYRIKMLFRGVRAWWWKR